MARTNQDNPKKTTIRNSDGRKTGAKTRTTALDSDKNATEKIKKAPFTVKAQRDIHGNTWAKVGKVRGKVDENGKVKLWQDDGNGAGSPLHAKTKLGGLIRKVQGRIVSRQIKRADPTAETDYEAYGKNAREAGVKGKVYNPNETNINTKGKARDKGTTTVDKKVYGKNGNVETTPTKVKVKTHVNVKKR